MTCRNIVVLFWYQEEQIEQKTVNHKMWTQLDILKDWFAILTRESEKKKKKKKKRASAGNRTRIDCLEGNHADLYTTDACGNTGIK